MIDQTIAQRTLDWEKWRAEGIGSSDAPAVMQASSFMTKHELWQIKRGLKKGFEGNFVTDRGTRLEPVARAQYELIEDIDMPPVLVQHKDHDFVRASLDGYNEYSKRILEIKCPFSKANHQKALDGQVPETYIWQLVHQMMAADAVECDFFSFHPDFEGDSKRALIKVKRDLDLEAKLLKAEIEFWQMVKDGIEPELTEKEIKRLERAAKKAAAQSNVNTATAS